MDQVVDAAPQVQATDGAGFEAAGMLPAALLLAACGADSGGGSSAAPDTPAAAPPTPQPAMAEASAARFLSQATLGATRAEIAKVRAGGYAAWLDEQFAKPRATHWEWLVARGYGVTDNQFNQNGLDNTLWRQMIAGDDQLRQRVVAALLEILVVSANGLTSAYKQFVMAAYVDLLGEHAFGNYRTLLEAVALSPAMGQFLTYAGNRKANAATNAVPDENFARELMQLFTIGTSQLESDGTVRMNGARPAETYGPADVAGLARVFTGWDMAPAGTDPIDRYRQPMVNTARNHETGEKSFLGTTLPSGADAAATLARALDAIFAHPNVPPFVARQLIQRMVTSNPSPAYVGRVAAAFAGGGGTPRGDMKATIRAVLLDAEARDDGAATAPAWGRLREPMMRLTGWARAFGVTSASESWNVGDTSNPANRLGQSPGRAPSVFNFFRPGYVPSNTPVAAQGLVAPEFQLTSEPSVVGYLNYMQSLVNGSIVDLRPDYGDLLPLAADAAALVDEVAMRLAGGQPGTTARSTIRAAVDSISAASADGPLNRVRTAVLLVLASPDYLVQR